MLYFHCNYYIKNINLPKERFTVDINNRYKTVVFPYNDIFGFEKSGLLDQERLLR